jgi:cytochrome P450
VIINDPARKAGMDLSTGSVIHMDPPAHAAHRKLVNAEFTPRAVGRLEPAVRATVQRVLDDVPAGEEIDAVAAVTAPIPVSIAPPVDTGQPLRRRPRRRAGGNGTTGMGSAATAEYAITHASACGSTTRHREANPRRGRTWRVADPCGCRAGPVRPPVMRGALPGPC